MTIKETQTIKRPAKLTPMLRQYLEIKEQHQDAILFYRMGDFYEMFFEDAKVASKVLGITLTSRNNKSDANKVPMCGIPYHAAPTYLAKLVNNSFRVAICEQTEDPSQAKGIVKREVVRIVSPGVVTDAEILDEKTNCYVASLVQKRKADRAIYGLSFLDLSTGQFLAGEIFDQSEQYERVLDQLTRMGPAELLIRDDERDSMEKLISAAQALLPGLCITSRPSGSFSRQDCKELLLDHFNVVNLAGFGCDAMTEGIIAAGIVLEYAIDTQKSDITHIEKLAPIDMESILQIDDSSRRNLELTRTIIGDNRDGSLLAVLDHTCTPMGARLLKHYLLSPLQDVQRIKNRLDSVHFLLGNPGLRKDLKEKLSAIYDIERLNSRMVLGSGNARDMLALKQSLAVLPDISQLLAKCQAEKLSHIHDNLDTLQDLFNLIETVINEEAPVTLRDGHLIKEGYNTELDELIHIQRDTKQLILELEAREREKTGIAKLKVGFNRVFGYYLEISRSHSDKAPDHYIRKQTLVNGERFITPELKEFENKVLGAQEKRLRLEYQLFSDIRKKIAQNSGKLIKTANLLAQVDVLTCFAETAHLYNYRKPEINDDEIISITEGRHPVIERSMAGGKFVPNDLFLDQSSEEVLIITGPNMAGKSTVLRQTALIVLMAQMGSFVPADKAIIGVVDRIFTRVGAMDDLRRGQSTFMVEMNETANILNNATEKSLVILDEIGRGTSTYDGLAIAWAVAEDLVMKNDKGVKTLFATHYHELTDLARTHPRVHNYSIGVREWNETIIFLHKLIKGGTNRSYGIQVAGLAGVPERVIKRAQEILSNIEKGEFDQYGQPIIAKNTNNPTQTKPKSPRQPSLFPPPQDPLREALSAIAVDDLSPRQALELLYDLKKNL